MHRAWLTARDQALAAVRAGDGLILVLGPPGTGKSLLLQELARLLGSGGYDVLFQFRGDITVEADDVAADSPKQSLRRVVLVDEADRMTEAVLKRLEQLGAASLVCAGLDGTSSGFGRRPATVVRLALLAPDEVGAFAAARLARAGRPATPLGDEAIQRLAERSGGVPRVVVMLADAAAFLAALDGAACITASHIDQAAAMRGDDEVRNASLPEAEPNGTMQPQAAEKVWEASPLARQAVRRSPGQAHAALSLIERTAAMQAGMVPNALPVRTVRENTVHLETAADEPTVPVLVKQETKQGFTWGRGAALSAASGIAALCGWLTLQPVLPVQQGQPVPEQPATIAVLFGSAGQGASSNKRPDTTLVLPEPPGAARQAEEGSASATRLPAGVPGHVIIYYARNDAVTEAKATDLARMLLAAGMMVDDLVAIPRQTRVPGVRYFFAEDRDTADEVLGWAGLSFVDLRASAARPGALPRPGMIEVTMPPS
ncbi:MAG: AAA family ATPase [Janthinobacterium lividum]